MLMLHVAAVQYTWRNLLNVVKDALLPGILNLCEKTPNDSFWGKGRLDPDVPVGHLCCLRVDKACMSNLTAEQMTKQVRSYGKQSKPPSSTQIQNDAYSSRCRLAT